MPRRKGENGNRSSHINQVCLCRPGVSAASVGVLSSRIFLSPVALLFTLRCVHKNTCLQIPLNSDYSPLSFQWDLFTAPPDIVLTESGEIKPATPGTFFYSPRCPLSPRRPPLFFFLLTNLDSRIFFSFLHLRSFVSLKAGRRMPSIFMRFWYTSFHLTQYLLYQEIGGGRMTDQTDIGSLSFHWQPPPPPLPPSFSFLFLYLHPSFLSSSLLLLGNWNLNSSSIIVELFLTRL